METGQVDDLKCECISDDALPIEYETSNPIHRDFISDLSEPTRHVKSYSFLGKSMGTRAQIEAARRDLTMLRRSIADQIALIFEDEVEAAGITFRADDNLSEMISRFDRNEGGVLCGHAALVLWRALIEKGYVAWTVHFGFETPAKLTHVGVLVRLHEKYYYLDPYFNFEFLESFEDVIKAYKTTGILDIIDDGDRPRTMYLLQPLRGEKLIHQRWRFANGDLAAISKYPTRCIGRFHIRGYTEHLHPSRWEELTRLNLAPRYENIFLFPYAVHNLENGYINDPIRSPLLAHLISVTGCVGKPNEKSNAVCYNMNWHVSLRAK